jgi:hypothetical protein
VTRVNEATWLKDFLQYGRGVPRIPTCEEHPTFDVPFASPFTPDAPSLFQCIAFVWIVVTLVSFLLPRALFIALFRIQFPFMPDKLS